MCGVETVIGVLENLTLTNALLLGGLMLVVLAKVADYRGWTRSPALVRQENADLRERNATLAAEVERLDKADRDKAQQIAVLEGRVEELQKRDQTAVLNAISAHENTESVMWSEAKTSSEAMHALLREHETNATRRHEQNADRHNEALGVWREIRDSLKDHPATTKER